MAHQLIVILNLVGLMLFDLFLSADLSITQNVPATMQPGSEVRVTVTVNKGGLSGFAKLQLDLPPGLTATAIETKGASFTFADQKAKYIWMALPSSPTFKVSYTLSADAAARGPLTIQGRLSYIEDNERKTYDLPASTVDLGDGAPAAVAQTEREEPEPDAMDLVSAAGGAPVTSAVPAMMVNAINSIAPMQGPGNVSGSRVITPITETEMLVEVVVKKGDIRGFGKLQETIPAGFTAMEKTSDEAIFTAQDRVVKFVWLNLPARPEIRVVYKLRANKQPEGEYAIDGDFGYLLNDETQRATLGTSKFHTGAKAFEMIAGDPGNMGQLDTQDPALALREKQTAAEESARKAAEEAARKTQEEAGRREAQAARPKPQAPAEKATLPPAGRIPAPEKGVVYKVQITAAHREVGNAYFKARHRYAGDFQLERHEGWVKYVTGRFTDYKQARDQRVDLVRAGHDFPGPFVTAYQDGERITVQQALMISNQNWVQ